MDDKTTAASRDKLLLQHKEHNLNPDRRRSRTVAHPKLSISCSHTVARTEASGKPEHRSAGLSVFEQDIVASCIPDIITFVPVLC